MSNEPTDRRIARMWGECLRQERIRQGFTQTTFAEHVGQGQGTISRYERGNLTWQPEMMLVFAVGLNTTVPALFPWPEGFEDVEKSRQLVEAKASAA